MNPKTYEEREDERLREQRTDVAVGAARRRIDEARDGVRSAQTMLVRATEYLAKLTANEDGFVSRAQLHHGNRTLILVFVCLLPLAYGYDLAFTFPSITNSLSSVALVRYFPSLATWAGQLRLCALFAGGAILINVALKLVTETTHDSYELKRARPESIELRRLKRRLILKQAVRLLYLVSLVGASVHMWLDAQARAVLTARAHGVAPTVNHGILVVLAIGLGLHALLLWFPVTFFHRDPAAELFMCTPHRVRDLIARLRAARERSAQALQRAVEGLPCVLQARLSGEIPLEIRMIANEALGFGYFSKSSPAVAPVEPTSKPIPNATPVVDLPLSGAVTNGSTAGCS